MKTIEQLEKEAKQAREVAIATTDNPFELMSTKIDSIILASVAMVTYQFALGMQEVSGDGSGESLPEYIEKKMKSNIAASQDYLTGDGSGKSLPEVSQEERNSDGFIKWVGGKCPVKETEAVEVKFRLETIRNDIDVAGIYRWNHADKSGVIDGDPQVDIVAYRIVKGE